MADDPHDGDVAQRIAVLFENRGANWYAGEEVTQLQHALQAASLAEQATRPAAEIAAALLHDIGHLVHDHGEDCAVQGVDDVHENEGAEWLGAVCGFGPEVTEPIRLHVPAKRYLCAVDPEYFGCLSQASVLSLRLQGGPFSNGEVAAFRESPYSESAVRLRVWDDQAKQPGLDTPPLSHFLLYLDEALPSGR